MNELILVLEENPEIQAIISASLKDSPIFINQELNPDFFFQQVKNLNPDLIFISNSDSEQNYTTCRKIREDQSIKNIPIVLLVNAKDMIDENLLRELEIEGILRKPFEASMLKEQISQYISLDENFGAKPDKGNDNFTLDISSIDNDLKEIKQQKHIQLKTNRKRTETISNTVKKNQDSSHAIAAGSNMDSLVLEDILIDDGSKSEIDAKEDSLVDGPEETTDDPESAIDSEFGLNSNEKPKTELIQGGLEKLKLSGLEDKYAESRVFKKNGETEQKLRDSLVDIELETNDFEDPSVLWSDSPDLDQKQREGMTDISLNQTDFHPSFPKHLTPFEESSGAKLLDDEAMVEQISKMDNNMLQTEVEESDQMNGNVFDDMVLTDSEEIEEGDDESFEDLNTFDMDSSPDELHEGLIDIRDDDDEINSMVKESIEDQGFTNSETALEELEDLSLQMESLEAEEDELETEEKDLEKTRTLNEEKIVDFQEDELTEFMVDELGDLLEIDEYEDSREIEQYDSPDSEISYSIEEDVFASWDDAEDAFIGFDKDSGLTEDKDWTEKETGTDKNTGTNFYEKEYRYKFNEDELKDIVTNSVQNALEKSIASSLVEMAVSEIKNNVSGRF